MLLFPCSSHNLTSRFICPSTEVFGTASIIVSPFILYLPPEELIHFIVGCHRSPSPIRKRRDLLVRALNFPYISHDPQLPTSKPSCLLLPYWRNHTCYLLVNVQTIPQ